MKTKFKILTGTNPFNILGNISSILFIEDYQYDGDTIIYNTDEYNSLEHLSKMFRAKVEKTADGELLVHC